MKFEEFDAFAHQKKFVESTSKFPALVAGYGSGKTVAFCLKGIRELFKNPFKTILLAEPVYPMITDVLQPTLENMLNELKLKYNYIAGEKKYIIYWKRAKGCIILRSAENWRRWAGLNLAAFGIDEAALLKDDSAWKMGISRLRDGSHLTGFTTTTPEGFNWHYTYWKDDVKKGYELIHGRTKDNTFLPKEFIETLLDNYDSRLIKAYLNGEYVNLQKGQAYYNFSRSFNVKKTEYNPSKNIRFALDFNVNPMCAVLVQVYNREPKIRIFDEIKISHSETGELMTERIIRELKIRYPKEEYDILDLKKSYRIKDNYICYPDPAGKQRRTSARLTDHDIIKKEGLLLKVKRAAPRVTDRLNSMNNAFKSMAIDPRCRELIKDLEQVALKDGTREIDKSNIERSHMTDALGYFVDFEFPVRKPLTKTFMA